MPLDFRKNTPPPLISPRDQLRILMLLGMMVLVLIAMNVAGRPGNWEWLWDQQPSAKVPDSELPDPVVTLAQSRRSSTAAESDTLELPSAASLGSTAPEPIRNSTFPSTEVPTGPFGLELSRLAAVRDNTRLRMRGNEEAEPYYYVLDFASRVEPSELDARARRDLTFAHFFESPGDYRGELVHLQGSVKRLIEYEAGPNDYGIEQLYEAWLFTEDSYNNPYVVVCTSIPSGMPMGDGISERVRVAGFFFKNNAYSAADVPRIAPMILAQRLVWIRPAVAGSGPHPLKLLGWVGVIGVIVAGSVLFWLRHRRALSPAERLTESSPAVLDGIDASAAGPQPEEFLEQLGREDPEPQGENDPG